jgi:SynChlorMet cassette radical SAM/SPASM protein ScmE
MPNNFQKNLMRTPKSVDIAITGRCNLRCKHCSHFNSAGDTGKDLPAAEWLKFFAELGSLAVMEVCLEGGEPFYRSDIKELISGIVRGRMRFSILSNGTLIDEKTAAFLAKTGRCNSVQVSIDGSNATVHEALRGKGAFVKAVEGLYNLKKNRVNVTVRVTVNKYNLNDLDNIAQFLFDGMKLASFSTNSASYLGLCRQFSREIQLTVDEQSQAMAELIRLNKKYKGRISAMAGPLANAKTWPQMDKARKEGLQGMPGCGYLTSCGGVLNKLAVLSDGTIVPCLQMPHIELGQINRDNLQKIWQEHPELKRLRQRRSVPLSDFDFCMGCDYIKYCRGSCPALAYTITGSDFHPSPDGCLRLFLAEGGRLPEEVFALE